MESWHHSFTALLSPCFSPFTLLALKGTAAAAAYLFLEMFNTKVKKKVVKEVCCTNNIVGPAGYLHNSYPERPFLFSLFIPVNNREQNCAEIFLKVVPESSESLILMLPSTVGNRNYI